MMELKTAKPERRLQIEQISYKGREVISGDPITLNLYANHLYYHGQSKAKVDDESIAMPIEKEFDNTLSFTKSHISMLDMHFANKAEVWTVDIGCSSSDIVSLVFKEKGEAEKVYWVLYRWLYE